MTDPRTPTTGEVITTFTLFLFALLLTLAAMAEPSPLKAWALGLCALFSGLGAARFKIQQLVQRQRNKRP